MDLLEVMRCTPSTRRFTEEPVDVEVVKKALDDARFAPSGGNRQPWRVIVITDEETRRTMRELYWPPWEAYVKERGGDPEGPVSDFARALDRIPLHLIVCCQMDYLAIVDADLDRPSIAGGASIYPFCHNVMLALRNEGLGTAFTTLMTAAEPQLRELLEVPPELGIAGHILVGHRADPWPKKLTRNPVESFAFAEKYGQPLG